MSFELLGLISMDMHISIFLKNSPTFLFFWVCSYGLTNPLQSVIPQVSNVTSSDPIITGNVAISAMLYDIIYGLLYPMNY